MRKKLRDIDTLALMLKRGDIGKAEFEAGRRFQDDFARAGMTGIRALDYEGTGGGSGPSNPTENAVMASAGVADAITRLGGMECVSARVLWDIIGLGRSMSEWASANRYDAKEAKGILLGAIAQLARAYGFV